MINKSNLPREELKGKKLYHYTSFDSFVKIWLSQTLLFGDVGKVNDILEHKYTLEMPNLSYLALDEAFRGIRNSYKQISFTLDYDNMNGFECAMMWGQYADKARGECIEFDFDKISKHFNQNMEDGFVNYPETLPRMPPLTTERSIKDIKNLIAYYRKEIFYTKHQAWKYENEYRIITNKEEALKIDDAISAVYLTSSISDECLWVEKILSNTLIPVLVLIATEDNYQRYFDVVNPAEHRKKIQRNKSMVEQAKRLFEHSKDNEDSDLIMKSVKLS